MLEHNVRDSMYIIAVTLPKLSPLNQYSHTNC